MLAKKFTRIFNKCSQYHVAFSSNASFEEIPSPRGLPLVGTTFSLIATGGPKNLHKYINKRHNELGVIFKDNVGPVKAVFLADPGEMRDVFAKEGKYPLHIKPESWLLYNEKYNYSRGLFFMDGEEWLRFRRIMNAFLLKGDLTWMKESCDVATQLLLNKIDEEKDREFENIEEVLYKWSLDVMFSVLLGANTYEKCNKDIKHSVRRLAKKVQLIFENTVKLQIFPAQLAMKYNLPIWKKFEESVSNALVCANDMLNTITENVYSQDGLYRKMIEESMENKDINRIIVDLILSAGDTTANTMAWLLFLLSKHKKHQTELRECLKIDPQTPLLRNIVKETLRLYPVAPFLTRILPENTSICGYDVPAGTLIVMSIYSSGRNEKYFSDHETFHPDRWTRDKGTYSSMQQASLPFGIGSRSCIGKKIAMNQLQIATSKIINNFEVDILNEREIKDIVKMVSIPSKPLRLIFKKLNV